MNISYIIKKYTIQILNIYINIDINARMIIFELDLRRLKHQILVKNLSGAILCRLSKLELYSPQTLQKRIRKKLGNDVCLRGARAHWFCIHLQTNIRN